MASRLELQETLVELLGSKEVYFQAPTSKQMHYPAIKYELSNLDITHADDQPYARYKQYSITVIDEDPDSEISERVSMLPMCRFNRHYNSDELNHFVYTIYY